MQTLKVGVAGQGAFGQKHLSVLRRIEGVEVITLTGGNQDTTAHVAKQFGIPHFTDDLAESLARPGLDAMILASPTYLHAPQAEQVMRAGKHVQIEIPVCDSLRDTHKLIAVQKETGVVAMGGMTRRHSPAHDFVFQKLRGGDKLHHFSVQSVFNRWNNVNVQGNPRSWFDHLLWHHACHTVDLFHYMTGEDVHESLAVQSEFNPAMQTAMDMGIVMKSSGGALCTLTLSFRNKAKKQGTTFRYMCEGGVYVCYYDSLTDGDGNDIDFPGAGVTDIGVEMQDREFVAAIREHREPNGSLLQVLPAMHTLHELEEFLTT